MLWAGNIAKKDIERKASKTDWIRFFKGNPKFYNQTLWNTHWQRVCRGRDWNSQVCQERKGNSKHLQNSSERNPKRFSSLQLVDKLYTIRHKTFCIFSLRIFSDIEKVKTLTHAFRYVTRMVSDMLTFHSSRFLPPHLTNFFMSLLKLRDDFDLKAEKGAVKRTKPDASHKSAPVEVFPNNPEHTVENTYKADLQEDKTEDKSCSKVYNSKFDITLVG